MTSYQMRPERSRFRVLNSLCWIFVVASDSVRGQNTGCQDPPSIDKGAAFRDGGTTTYRCSDGYILVGNGTTVCQPTGNWTDAPRCLFDCGAIPDFPNTIYTIVNSPDQPRTLEGSALLYRCMFGYTIVGRNSHHSVWIRCTSSTGWTMDGSGSLSIECIPTCLDPPQIVNGSWYGDDSSATYRCDTGYRLYGNRTIECLQSNTWTFSPECIFACNNPPSVKNGEVLVNEDTSTYKCNTGYLLNGTNLIKCLTTGNWTSPPECISEISSTTAEPKTLTTTTPTPTKYVQSSTTPHISTVTTTSTEQSSLTTTTPTPTETVTLSTAQLTSEMPSTICGSIPSVEHAQAFGSVLTELIITYHCDTGFYLVRNKTIKCQPSGNWTEPPLCIFECGQFPAVEHAAIQNESQPYESPTLPGTVILYECNTPYVIIGNKQITCMDEIGWTPAPVCVYPFLGSRCNHRFSDACSSDVANSHCDTSDTPRWATCQCDNGYANVSSVLCLAVLGNECDSTAERDPCAAVVPNSQCVVSGTGGVCRCVSGSINMDSVSCEVLDTTRMCGAPQTIANGTVYGFEFMRLTLMYKCDRGYHLIGNDTIKCQSSNNWTDPPKCVFDCGPIPDVENSVVSVTYNHYEVSTLEGSIIKYLCDTPYVIIGNEQITCTNGSGWQSAPECVIRTPVIGKECNMTQDSDVCAAALPNSQCFESESGSVCQCVKGYKLIDSVCKVVFCGDPPVIEHGNIFGFELPASAVTYRCNSGYSLIGNDTIECQKFGNWTEPPTCVFDCGPIPYVNDSSMIVLNNKHESPTLKGSIVYYDCDEYYDIIGDERITCSRFVGWQTAPKCVSRCRLTQFQCVSDGHCIELNRKCDHHFDCTDGSDELNCECGSQEFRCFYMGIVECIDKYFYCDGVRHCVNGTDELDCPRSAIEVRLVNGNTCLGGLVQVLNNGEWRYVCDDGFDEPEATVVCRMLGYNAGVGKVLDEFGVGDGSFWLDEVKCVGNEYTISECETKPWGQHECRNDEAVGVQCAGTVAIDCAREHVCTPSVNCTFDVTDCCYYSYSYVTWVWNTAAQIGFRDHTSDDEDGGIVYYQNKYGNPQDKAILILPATIMTNFSQRLQFAYLVSASNYPTLYLESIIEGIHFSLRLWESNYTSPEMTGTWISACVDIDSNSVYGIPFYSYELLHFVARRGENGDSKVALDDINITNGTCYMVTCGNPPNIENGNFAVHISTVTELSYTYECISGFFLIGNNTIECLFQGNWTEPPSCILGLFCDPVNDSRGITWKETHAGLISTELCPHNYTGNVTRECSVDGTWLSPRYNCVRESVEQIQNEIKELTNVSSDEEIDRILQDIVSVTTTTVNDTLTESEMDILVNQLDIVAELRVGENITDNISNGFLEIASNLLDGYNKPTWKSLDEFNDDTAERLVSLVETIAELLTNQLNTSSNNATVITKTNIAIEIRRTWKTDIVFPLEVSGPDWVTDDTSYIRVPAEALPDGFIISTGILFRNMSQIMPANTKEHSDQENKKTVNGPVLALTVRPDLQTVNPNLQIIFEHSLTGYIDPECSFWIVQSNYRGYWSNEGCSLVATSSTHTTCECDHLTNFAVLMSPFKEAAVDDTALRVVSIIGIIVSMLCLSLTFGIHVYLWRFLHNDRVVILTNLCTALIISYVVFLAGVDRTEQKAVCAFVAALLQYIYLVVFCIMLVEGIVVAITVLFVFMKNYRTKLLLALAWVVPAVITGVSLGITKTDGYGNDNFCWLSVNNALIYAFVGPALAIILVNVIVICLVIRAMFQTKAVKEKQKMDKLKISIRSLCVLVPLMGVSWVLGILYINDNMYWMQYVFAVCNGLQGVSIFLFHCVFNEHVRNAIKEDRRRRSSASWTTDRVSSNTDNTRGHNTKTTSIGTVDKNESIVNNDKCDENDDVFIESEISRENTSTHAKKESTVVNIDNENSQIIGMDINQGSNKDLNERSNEYPIASMRGNNRTDAPNIFIRTLSNLLNYSEGGKRKENAGNTDVKELSSGDNTSMGTVDKHEDPMSNDTSDENEDVLVEGENSRENTTTNATIKCTDFDIEPEKSQSIKYVKESVIDPPISSMSGHNRTHGPNILIRTIRTYLNSSDGEKQVRKENDGNTDVKDMSSNDNTSIGTVDKHEYASSNDEINDVLIEGDILRENTTKNTKKGRTNVDIEHEYSQLIGVDISKHSNKSLKESFNDHSIERKTQNNDKKASNIFIRTIRSVLKYDLGKHVNKENANSYVCTECSSMMHTSLSRTANDENISVVTTRVNTVDSCTQTDFIDDHETTDSHKPLMSNTHDSTHRNSTYIDQSMIHSTHSYNDPIVIVIDSKNSNAHVNETSTDSNKGQIKTTDSLYANAENTLDGSPNSSNDLIADVNELTNCYSSENWHSKKSYQDTDTDLIADLNKISNQHSNESSTDNYTDPISSDSQRTAGSSTENNIDPIPDVNTISNQHSNASLHTDECPINNNIDLNTDVNNINNSNIRHSRRTNESSTDHNTDLCFNVNTQANTSASDCRRTSESPTHNQTDRVANINNLTSLDTSGSPQTNESLLDRNTYISADGNNLTNLDSIGSPQTNEIPTDSNTNHSVDGNNLTNRDNIDSPQTKKIPNDSISNLSIDENNLTKLDSNGSPQKNEIPNPKDSKTKLSADGNNRINPDSISSLQTNEIPTDSNANLSIDENILTNLDSNGSPQKNEIPTDSKTKLSADGNNRINPNSISSLQTNEIPTDSNANLSIDENNLTKLDSNGIPQKNEIPNPKDSKTKLSADGNNRIKPNSISSLQTNEIPTDSNANLSIDENNLTKLDSNGSPQKNGIPNPKDSKTKLSADGNSRINPNSISSLQTNEIPTDSNANLSIDENNLTKLDSNGSPQKNEIPNPKDSKTKLSADGNNLINPNSISSLQTNEIPTDSNANISSDGNNLTSLDSIDSPKTNEIPTDSNTYLSANGNNLTNLNSRGSPQTNESPTDSNADIIADEINLTNPGSRGSPQTNESLTCDKIDIIADGNNLTNLSSSGSPQTYESHKDSTTDLIADGNNLNILDSIDSLQTNENPTDNNTDVDTSNSRRANKRDLLYKPVYIKTTWR